MRTHFIIVAAAASLIPSAPGILKDIPCIRASAELGSGRWLDLYTLGRLALAAQ
jgi:hypothetical protein